MKKYFDHSTKPTTYCIEYEGDVVFRGTYADGILFVKASENGGKIDFLEDYIPAMRKLRKYCQRGFKCERELKRQIIKLKKEIKCAK